MEPSPWRRHRALAVLAEAWPSLAAGDPPSCEALDGWLRDRGSRWRLASPRAPKPEAKTSYEATVVSGAIPTREGSWHDTFNVLSFITFPHTKHALHGRYLELAHGRRDPTTGRLGNRSREEDALALLDEATVVLAGSTSAVEAVDDARSRGVPLEALDAVVRSRGVVMRVLGHALLEHLVLERPTIGAGVVTIAVEGPATPDAIDRALAARIAAGGFPVPRMRPTLPWPDPLVEAWIC